MIKKTLSTLVLLAGMSGIVNAEDSPINQLKAFLKASASLTADFKQVSYNKAGQVGQSSFGQFYLSRPGKFRWNYQKPFAQEI